MPGARVRTWFDVGSARTRHVPMNRLCVRRRGGGHTQDLLDRHSEVIFSFNLLFEPPDLLASSQGFILTAGLKRITNEEQLRLQADFCKMCEGSAVGRCPGQPGLSWWLWGHCPCSGKTLLAEGQTLSAQRNAGCSSLGNNGDFCYMLGTFRVRCLLNQFPALPYLPSSISDETIRVGWECQQSPA